MEQLLFKDFTNSVEFEGADNVGSLNHSAAQANLAFLLKRLGTYSVFTDLSLSINKIDLTQFDISTREEIKPDVCVYPKRKFNPINDILKMEEMPLLAIEIVSPKQGLYEILEKFKLYFALGVQSCWLVIPSTQTVTVYAGPNHFQTIVSGDVVDTVVNIRLPLSEIFE